MWPLDLNLNSNHILHDVVRLKKKAFPSAWAAALGEEGFF
jgi:hypothetical protein